MSKNFIILLYVFTLLFYGTDTIAQEVQKPKALTQVLNELQERFGIQFNYASTLVDGVTVSSPDFSLPLKTAVANLSIQSNLDFVFVTESIVSIKKKKSTICGYLKDKLTGELLPYVTVQNGTKGTLTKEDGYFELDINTNSDVIQIRHIGHATLRKEAAYFNLSNSCEILYLVPDQEQLAEIVLYDYLIRGVDKLDNGSFQIDFNKFTILPGLIERDVLHSVQAFPGVQSIDETVSNINIRGGSNDQNLISWDDIKMYQSGHFFGLISMYNPNITHKVELRKNGSSAEETDGVSGTIAMQTEKYVNSDLKGSIGINLLDGNGYIDAPLGKKASIQVAARKSISDFLETPTYSEYFKRITQETEIANNSFSVTNSNVSFDFYDTSFRLLFNPSDKDYIRLNFIHTANRVSFNESAEVSGVEEIRESNLNQTSIAGGIQYKRNWTQNFATEVGIYETDYQLKGSNANIIENQRFEQKNTVSETGLRLKAQLKIGPQTKFTNGYQFVETKVSNLDDVDDPRYLLLEAEVLRVHALFSEIKLSSKNRAAHLNLGMRLNYLDKFKKQIWEPRLSFNYGFGQHFNLEVLGEFKHQNTSQVINFQNDFLGIEKRRWQLSNNETIPVITSKQVSMGLSYNQNGWLANAVSFYKKINGITTQSQGFQGRYEFTRQAGAYDAYGADLLIRKQLQNGSTWISYSYLNSTYFFKELPEASFPSNFDVNHALTVGANYTLNRFLFALGLNWHSGKPFTKPVVNNEVVDGDINFDHENRSRQEDYLRLDFSARHQFNWGESTRLQIGFALWNVLNRDNTLNSFYRLDSTDNIQKVEQSSLGITPNALIKLIFN
ncbi:hypothetical protein GGR42_001814 [Saonia flava]|uniref:TonB-dependent receptor n=1 Tax=Saonia flava TaxID=523696 RepID=A0A846QXL7_9FLAO|nr:TonB-dependent receptor plug domain-containing protein [Saonia flava]NJB71352.1 hypothetical protein [Saonia flava]